MLIEKYADSEITHNEFCEIINSSLEAPIVVHFFSEWCMNCLMFTPMIEDLADQLETVKFIKINVEENQGLVQKYSVSKTPCIIIFKAGEEVERIKGSQTFEMIEQKIKNYLN